MWAKQSKEVMWLMKIHEKDVNLYRLLVKKITKCL